MRALKYGLIGAVLLLVAFLVAGTSKKDSAALLLVQNNGQLVYTLTNSSPRMINSGGGLAQFTVRFRWTVGSERFTSDPPPGLGRNVELQPGDAAHAFIGIPKGASHVVATMEYTAHTDVRIYARELSNICRGFVDFERLLNSFTERQLETALDLAPVPEPFR